MKVISEDNPNLFVDVVAASAPKRGGARIATIHVRYPLIIHGEMMAHREFSRNARSQRAVPILTMLKEVWNNPFVPWHWGRNQKGMQARVPLTGWRRQLAIMVWLLASKFACVMVWMMMHLGAHKQLANRLLSPFLWIDTLITSTNWANFLHLRDHEDAEPHFMDLARMIRMALANAEYRPLSVYGWHLPFITEEERRNADRVSDLLKMSTARCARISFKPFDGNGAPEAEYARHDSLVGSEPLHASPTEHQARVALDQTDTEYCGNLGPGWIQYRKTLPGEYMKEAA